MKQFFTNPKFKLFLSALGLADASYLTYEHFAKASVFCISADSCDKVLSSAYATLGSLPLSVIGVLYYGLILALSVYFMISHEEKIAVLLFYVTSAGLAMSAIFVGLQIFVIHAICYWCMLSAITTTLLFITSLMSVREFEAEPQKI